MTYPKMIDLHMHSTVSDGTDAPLAILERVRGAGLGAFSLTDHDAIKGCEIIRGGLKEGDPRFIPGVEFSCRDDGGKYHILGYGYDPEIPGIREVVEAGHALRMQKVRARLDFIKEEYGFVFPDEEIRALLARDNPGKPHIGNLMVKYGYAATKEEAINNYINNCHFRGEVIAPGQAIEGILKSGGVPVLAHPFYGSGDQLILGEEMDARLKYLVSLGLKGLEAFYSGFSPRLRSQALALADKYDLYVTAGSDYHGTNKLVGIGETGLDEVEAVPERLGAFLKAVGLTF